MQAIPAVLLSITAISYDDELFGPSLFFFIPSILSSVCFAGATPEKPCFVYPFTKESINDLKIYTRFPQGLTNEQYGIFLRTNNIQTIEKIK